MSLQYKLEPYLKEDEHNIGDGIERVRSEI
jgi:hypothetical protein